MMRTTTKAAPKPARIRGIAMALALSLTATGGLLAPNRADAWFASEVTQILNNISLMTNQLQDYAEYADNLNRWRQQAADMQRQIARLQNMALTLGIRPGQDLREVDENQNVAERCGGFNLSALTQIFNVNGSGDIYQQQKQTCANIQRMENTKYNETVRYLRSFADEANQDFRNLQNASRSSTDPGDLMKALQDSSNTLNKQEMQFKDFQNKMYAYDSYISVQRQNQKLLGQIALKGSRTNQVLGQLGRTAILEAALSN